MDNIEIAQFETMVKNINNSIKRSHIISKFKTIKNISSIANKTYVIGGTKNESLSMIYDYGKVNEYGKTIMKNASILITSGYDKGLDAWAYTYNSREKLKKPTIRIAAAEDFAKFCRENENKTEGYKFIFWALMILTVEKTDAEEHLSMICDFAQMLRITDEELEDIVTIIERIYNKNKVFYHYNTDIIPCILGAACDGNSIKNN